MKFVKLIFISSCVTPAKAGIQKDAKSLDDSLRWHDKFWHVTIRQTIFFLIGLLIISNITFAQTKSNVYDESKLAVTVSAGKPTFIIKLKSNPTTGYSWFLREYHPTFLVPIRHKFETPTDKNLMGAPGYEVWTFRVKPEAFVVPQQTLIRLVYVRPWETPGRTQQVVFRVSSVVVSGES